MCILHRFMNLNCFQMYIYKLSNLILIIELLFVLNVKRDSPVIEINAGR